MRCIELGEGACCELQEGWLSAAEALDLHAVLSREVPWERREIEVYGRKVWQPRLVAWVGDPAAVYTYSRTRHVPLSWTESLAALRERVTETTGVPFNSVLCNLYRDGQDSMGMHSDSEPELGPEPVIASVSLGATRRFSMRHRRGGERGKLDLDLEHGSLFVMRGTTQRLYRHGVPKQPSIRDARINLTFRLVLPQERWAT
jgi:alkylated DNA repair dioxygenase AlkB